MRAAVRKKMHLQLTTFNLKRFNLVRAIRASPTQKGRTARICTAAEALVANAHQICLRLNGSQQCCRENLRRLIRTRRAPGMLLDEPTQTNHEDSRLNDPIPALASRRSVLIAAAGIAAAASLPAAALTAATRQTPASASTTNTPKVRHSMSNNTTNNGT